MSFARRAVGPPAAVFVVGHGAAAVHAVRGLREAGHEGVVQVLSDEDDTPYSPMLLAYYVGGTLPRERCFPFGPGSSLHGETGVLFHGCDPVCGLDAEERTVVTRSGARYHYETCIVATGARPLELPVPGASGERVHYVRTLEQADRLEQALAAGPRRVLVVGASLVGMKMVEALVLRGVEVVLVDVAPQVLPATADVECARLVARGLTARGVELHLGTRVEAFEESERGLRAWLSPWGPGDAPWTRGPTTFDERIGSAARGVGFASLDVDLAVVAVGVKPNVDFIDRGQVRVDQGVLVDRQCRGSAAGLYAAGDCAQMWSPMSGRHEVTGLWASACYQGRAAGRNAGRELAAGPTALAAFDTAPPALVHHVIHFLDWVFVSIGDPRAGDRAGETLEVCDPDRDLYYRLVVQDGQIVGANLLNCCDGAGMLRHAATRSRVRQAVAGSPPLGWARFVQETCGVGAAATLPNGVRRVGGA